MTVPAAPIRSRPSQAAKPGGIGRGDEGLIALEWLLIVGAVAGLAAYSVLAVQHVVDDATEIPDDPAVRFIDAEIAAAEIAAEATSLRLSQDRDEVVDDFANRGSSSDYTVLGYGSYVQRCTDLGTAFGDVVGSSTTFVPPVEFFDDYDLDGGEWGDVENPISEEQYQQAVKRLAELAGLEPLSEDQQADQEEERRRLTLRRDKYRFQQGEIKAGARCEVQPHA